MKQLAHVRVPVALHHRASQRAERRFSRLGIVARELLERYADGRLDVDPFNLPIGRAADRPRRTVGLQISVDGRVLRAAQDRAFGDGIPLASAVRGLLLEFANGADLISR